MFNVPPVDAMIRLKRMQNILQQEKELHFEFIKLGAECNAMFGMKAEEILNWIENGKSDV